MFLPSSPKLPKARRFFHPGALLIIQLLDPGGEMIGGGAAVEQPHFDGGECLLEFLVGGTALGARECIHCVNRTTWTGPALGWKMASHGRYFHPALLPSPAMALPRLRQRSPVPFRTSWP